MGPKICNEEQNEKEIVLKIRNVEMSLGDGEDRNNKKFCFRKDKAG